MSGFDPRKIDFAAKAQEAGALAVGGISVQVVNKVVIGALEKQLGTGQKVRQVANAITGVGGLLIGDFMPGNKFAEDVGKGMAAVSMANLGVSFIPAETRDKLGIGRIGTMSVLDLPVANESLNGYGSDPNNPNIHGYGNPGGQREANVV